MEKDQLCKRKDLSVERNIEVKKERSVTFERKGRIQVVEE